MIRMFSLAGMFGLLALPLQAAAILPATPCTGLIGCGAGTANLVLQNIPDLASLMITLAAGGAVVFIAWAGLQMVIALGDDAKIAEQRWAIFYALAGLAVVILAQTIVSLVGTEPNLGAVTAANLPVDIMIAAVNIILTSFNAVFAVAIIVGAVRMVYAQGKSDEFNKGRTLIFWSVFGAIVTNIANALVQALSGMFGV